MSDVRNVTPAKPAVGGAVYRGAKDTTLPTDTSTELASGFTNLGFITQEGVTNGNSPSTESIKAWGGAVVADLLNERPDTFKMVFMESTNLEVLKMIYGESNVTGTLASGIKVSVKPEMLPEVPYVIDMILKDNMKKRIVIPYGQPTALGDIVYVDNDIVKYDVTISAHPDDKDCTHYEYIKGATA